MQFLRSLKQGCSKLWTTHCSVHRLKMERIWDNCKVTNAWLNWQASRVRFLIDAALALAWVESGGATEFSCLKLPSLSQAEGGSTANKWKVKWEQNKHDPPAKTVWLTVWIILSTSSSFVKHCGEKIILVLQCNAFQFQFLGFYLYCSEDFPC